ncbi:pyridoxal phosphate-dependent decarboxylase family protein [Microbulbifer rhizosphaerae]|uniref:Glutamate/tyrosine decarboxylase-like PLP-dependent enzyme n=1 Tax=Microbulbifer rhizosphaerae TaxID=1562603 RepID=A0A7W4WEK0_9GAMM|nr:aminotransferase class I/II-fold pyridoxal phosphate-dependent enzyme [Microbulbifer rhizosphaerae]MBB3062780.1 glutamate/tyrosine decarboxylase-like PLP-dependent enzyme [Microbulbifer rhizosphaerae]
MSLMDSESSDLAGLLERALDTSLDFVDSLTERPSACVAPPDLPSGLLPEQGVGSEKTLDHFREELLPYLSASAGPRYWGFVTGGATPAALLGDWLSSVTDQNLSIAGDSIAPAVEVQVLDWLRQLFQLPETFSGSLTSGATSANLLGILCGRQFAGEAQGIDVAASGLAGTLIHVFSACPHASSLKGLAIAGLGRDSLMSVACEPDSEKMSLSALEYALSASGSPGKIVLASAGTVTGTDFDDLSAIADLCQKHRAWLHVDGAFGIFSRLLEDKRNWTDGLERADSITCDGHKWLNVPYDSGIFLTPHTRLLEQVLSVSSPYLVNDSALPSFMNRGVENSRRFRALPIWFSLQAYGRAGVEEMVAGNCQQAARLADWLEASPDYELLTPCKLNVVVFRPANVDDLTGWLKRVNATGTVFVTPGRWQGTDAVRAAFSNWSTTSADVDRVTGLLENMAKGESPI